MSTIGTKNPNTPSDLVGDLAEVCRQSQHGIVRDPELLRRIFERSEKARRAIQEKHGTVDIGVEIIRKMREGEA